MSETRTGFEDYPWRNPNFKANTFKGREPTQGGNGNPPKGGLHRGQPGMDRIVNDFTINIATANGTGSQSANLILLQTLFDMGIPVSGKNLFPSNISGLPTWYIVRLSEKGYQAPGDRTHIQILVNPATWEEDLAAVESGTVVIWNIDSKMPMEREDVISYPVPMTKIARGLNPKVSKNDCKRGLCWRISRTVGYGSGSSRSCDCKAIWW